MTALSEMPKGFFDSFKLAQMYGLWYESEPFDIGMTTRTGLKTLANRQIPEAELVLKTFANVNRWNAGSQSNGSLMRSTPIAVYGHLLSKEDLRSIIKVDCNFTHCHPNVIDAVYLYSLAIGSLIRTGDDPDRVKIAMDLILKECK